MFAPHLLVLEFCLLLGAFFLFKNFLEKRKKKSEATPKTLVRKFKEVRQEAEEALDEAEQVIRDAQRDRNDLLKLVDVEEDEVVEEPVPSVKPSPTAKTVISKPASNKPKPSK